MSSDNPKPEQIQANVAAALSRLRGDVMPPITSQAAPKLAGETAQSAGNPATAAPAAAPAPTSGAPKPSFFPQMPAATQHGTPPHGVTAPHGLSQQTSPQAATGGLSAGNAPSANLRAEPSLGLGNGASTMAATPAGGSNYFGMSAKPTSSAGTQPDLLSSVEMGPPPLAGYPQGDAGDGRRRRNRRLVLAGAVAAIAVVAAIWLAGGHKSEVPTLTAETTPEKVKPTDEGGLQVPNQNVQVLENMNGQNGQQQAGETVLPPPEQPVAPPTPAPDAQGQAGQAATGQAATGQAATGQAAAGQPATGEGGTQSAAAPAVPAVPDAPAVPAVPAVPDTPTAATAAAPAVPAAAPATSANNAAANNAAPAATQAAATEQVAAKPAEPAAKSATTQPAAGGKVKVQLAAVKSEAAAKSEWAKMQKAHPAQLGKLSLIVQKVDKGSGGVFYRIQAGPLADKAAAKALCAELAQQKQGCILAR